MSFGQGGPEWGPGNGGGPTPDWAALADESARRHSRRRRRALVGAGALATVAVAGIVAVAVAGGGDDSGDDASSSLPSPEKPSEGPGQPEPSFKEDRPPAPPQDFLNDPRKDTAPLTEKTLFPDEIAAVDGRRYARVSTDASPECAPGAVGGLRPVLAANDCQRFLRATYVRQGLAFTLGVGVFDSKADAAAVKSGYQPNVASLPGGNVKDFCRSVTCRTTVNSLGRYAFFTIAGHTDGKPAGDADEPAKQAALDGSAYGYERILQRGKDQSAADAAR
ncbi:hypothetical protein [Streptomyces phytohabitans]|uniref:hypothetical protein n=1 Tax=Streptomyces phytohabitans TaxID=1150371 RepID=UPI00345BB54F